MKKIISLISVFAIILVGCASTAENDFYNQTTTSLQSLQTTTDNLVTEFNTSLTDEEASRLINSAINEATTVIEEYSNINFSDEFASVQQLAVDAMDQTVAVYEEINNLVNNGEVPTLAGLGDVVESQINALISFYDGLMQMNSQSELATTQLELLKTTINLIIEQYNLTFPDNTVEPIS